MTPVALILFWAAVAMIAWAYAGFPAVLALRALFPAPKPRRGGPLPRVSFVIAVHDEASVIERKLANLEALDYPRDRIEVIVAADGCRDGTCPLVASHAGELRVTLLDLARIGKNAALNAGVAASSGEVLVFSDADSMLERDALERLVAPFADPTVGGVAGDFHYEKEGGRGGDGARGERTYWAFDAIWKRLESRAGNVTSATGQLYAIRREHFTTVPDGVTDDFYVSTGAIAAGSRLWFEPGAVARGAAAAGLGDEYQRKVRVIGRGFASVWQRRRLLDPRRTGFYAFQLLSHKVLRRLVGLPLIVLAVSSALLWDAGPFYRIAALAQLAFHGLALLGWLGRRAGFARTRLLSLPAFFDMANLAALHALVEFLRGRQRRIWEPRRDAQEAVRMAPVDRAN
jgi:cellulose synthase/poly-beta-1,6-N-acetylglucosamine synthase-like glycosyltransferase